MNWKVIVGILIILGSINEFFAEWKDFKTGVVTYNPLIPQLICIGIVGVGFYVIYNGRKQKETEVTHPPFPVSQCMYFPAGTLIKNVYF